MTQPSLEDVRFRPYGITDGKRLRRMSDRLSRTSLYTRFWTGTSRIPDHYAALLATLDHWDRDAMVALLFDEMIGIAEYVRDPRRPWRADVAVLVADPWQRRGLARALVGYLAVLAARRGITEFDADVLPENRSAMLLIRNLWPGAGATTADGAARYRVPLPIPATPG